MLLCPAIDFPIFKLEDLSNEEYEEYKIKGEFNLSLSKNPSDPKILKLRKSLILDAKQKSILTGPEICAPFPLRLLWGTADTLVPPERSDLLAHKLSKELLQKTQIHWQDGSDHQLGSPKDLLKLTILMSEFFKEY